MGRDSTTVGYEPRPPGSRPPRRIDDWSWRYNVSGQALGVGDGSAWHHRAGLPVRRAPKPLPTPRQLTGVDPPTTRPVPPDAVDPFLWVGLGGTSTGPTWWWRITHWLLADDAVWGRPFTAPTRLWNGDPDRPPRAPLRGETHESAATRGWYPQEQWRRGTDGRWRPLPHDWQVR